MGFWDGLFKKKAEKIEQKPEKQNLGASWNSSYGYKPVFPAKEALEAYGQHAYLYAAITRCSEDLSALPLKLIRGRGKNEEIIENHPVLDLLDNPSTMMDGYLFRQTLTLDLILNGTFYFLLIGAGKLPVSLIRLHPEETTFVTDTIKGIAGIKNDSDGKMVIYPPERVIYGRNASYAKGPKSLYGTGVVQPLYEELKSDVNAMQLSSLQSAQGRPDVLISPSDEADVWPKEVREEIVNSYTQMAKKGGAIALSGMAKIDLLNLSPREMEYKEARTMARQSISAACGISPSVLGLPSANYATAIEQRKTFWTNQKHRAKKLDAAYTKLAKLWNNDLRIEHDFSGIDALTTRDLQLARIEKHIRFGMSPIDAYSYEGLQDAPIGVQGFDEDEPTQDDEEKILSSMIQKNLDEEKKERRNYWYRWIIEKQAPAEAKLIRASSSFLRAIKKLILERYKKETGSLVEVESLINNSDLEELADKHLKEVYRKIYETNLNDEYNKIRNTIDKNHRPQIIKIDETDESTWLKWLGFYALMRSRIIKTTFRKLKSFFIKIKDEEKKKDVAAKLSASGAFAMSRADTIGRTESTILLNSSTMEAGNEAVKTEPRKEAKKQWITEGDAVVRAAHQELDGEIVLNQSNFIVPGGEYAGMEAFYPGGFGDAALDCNCRCTVRVIIEDF